MKQLLLTIKQHSAEKTQFEVRDFLALSTHSPQWIGNVDDWEISSFSCMADGKGKTQVTALLKNVKWEAPEIERLTSMNVFEKLKDLSTPIAVGRRQGIGTKLIPLCPSSIEAIEDGTEYKRIKMSGITQVAKFTVGDLFDKLSLSDIIELLKSSSINDDVKGINSFLVEEKIEERLLLKPIIIQFDEFGINKSLTEIVSVDNKIILVVNQDDTL